MADYKQVINKLKDDVEEILVSDKADGYGRLSGILAELLIDMREQIQKDTAAQVRKIMQALKSRKPLSADDKDILRLWIVGDAEDYVKMENNFEDWKTELRRAVGEAVSLAEKDLPATGVSRLRGLLQDATGVVNNIFNFAEQRERVGKFLDSTAEIDDEEREILYRLLEQKLKTEIF